MISRWPPPIPAQILWAWLSRATSRSSDWSGGGVRRRSGRCVSPSRSSGLTPTDRTGSFCLFIWNRKRASSAGWFDLFPFQLHNHSTLVVCFYPECHLCPMPVLTWVKLPREWDVGSLGRALCPVCVCLYPLRVFPHLVLVKWTDTMWKKCKKTVDFV